MGKLSRLFLFVVLFLMSATQVLKAEPKFKPEQLAPLLKNILEKLQTTDGLPVPSLSKPSISIDNGKVQLSGNLVIAGEALGTANLSITSSGDEIEVTGDLPDIDWGKLYSNDQLKCQITAPTSKVRFVYNTQIHVFTLGSILAKNFLIKCEGFEARFKRFEIKGVTTPKDMTGRYRAQLALLVEGMTGEAKPAEVGFSSDKLDIVMDFSSIYPAKRNEAIGFSYARYWPVKFPFLAVPGDLFLYLDPAQQKAEKLRAVLAGYDDLVINYKIENYRYSDPFSDIHFKKQKGKLSVFKPEFISTSEDESYLKAPETSIKLQYPTHSSFDFRIKGDPGFKNLADLGDLIKFRPDPMVFLQKFLNSYKHATFKVHGSNATAAISIEGKVESKLDMPLPEVAGVLKIKNPDQLIKSVFLFEDSDKDKVSGCISSLEALIGSFKSLAKKNSKTTDQEWHFNVKSSISAITINGEAVETIILPESHFTPDKCAVLTPLLSQ